MKDNDSLTNKEWLTDVRGTLQGQAKEIERLRAALGDIAEWADFNADFAYHTPDRPGYAEKLLYTVLCMMRDDAKQALGEGDAL